MASQPPAATILVLMPMLPGYEAVRETVAATIDRVGFGMLRLETLLEDWEWLDWLDQSIDRCDFVLADPSRHNPFVMYELGVARRRRRPTLIILDREDSQLSGSLDGSAYRPYANEALDAFSARLEADLTQLATPAAAPDHAGDLAAHHARAGELLAQLQRTSELPLEAVARGAFATRLHHAVAHGSFADDFADTPLGAAGLLAAITRSSRMLDTMDAIRTWVDDRVDGRC